ncbi:MAG TPA: HAD family phosphatase [Thermoanaerobaculia bacterium]|nr:HAD family phosphatase [Thermoanaerobaculia bacterium]
MAGETPDPSTRDSSTRAFIFDFDETIIDLEPQHTAAYVALCREMGSDYANMPESFRTGSGRRIIDDIREMRAYFDWKESEEELLARRLIHFDKACREADLQPMDGVVETIRALQRTNVPMAITSSAVKSSIEEILIRLGVRDAFTLIVDGSEVVHGKPDPEAYLLTARKLNVQPGECVVFEDSNVGVIAAKRAGMVCIAVRNPRAQQRQDLSAADVVLESMRDVDVNALSARSAPRRAG